MAEGIFVIFCYPAWRWAKCRWKFTLHIKNTELQFGRWPFRESVSTLAVQTVHETAGLVNVPSSYWVKITAPGIKWKCFFGSHVPACIEALRAVCTNAIFIDVAGQEYLPTKTYDPHTVLRNLVRTRLRRATAFLLVAIPCLVWGAIVIIAIIVGFNKGATPTDILSEVNIGFFIVPVLGLFSLTAAITQFRKAKSLSKRIKTELAQGMDDTVLGHAIDLSQSGIERM